MVSLGSQFPCSSRGPLWTDRVNGSRTKEGGSRTPGENRPATPGATALGPGREWLGSNGLASRLSGKSWGGGNGFLDMLLRGGSTRTRSLIRIYPIVSPSGIREVSGFHHGKCGCIPKISCPNPSTRFLPSRVCPLTRTSRGKRGGGVVLFSPRKPLPTKKAS